MKEQEIVITNMSCTVCQDKVKKALLALDGVISADVSFIKSKALVCYDENRINADDFINAVKQAGYRAYLKDGAHHSDLEMSKAEGEALRVSLVLSFVCTAVLILISSGPMFSFTIFEKALHSFLVQLLLSSFVIVLNRRFFISAFAALKKLTCNMDTLVSLGSLSAFIYSLASIFSIDGNMGLEVFDRYPLYFESAAGILTFVSIGKYLEKRTIVKTNDSIRELNSLISDFVTVKTEDGEKQIAADALRAGDIVIVRQGQRLGADGVVVKGHAFLDSSSLTGESLPVEAVEGVQVFSSSLVTEGYIEVLALKVSFETVFSQIIKSVEKTALSKTRAGRLADATARVFVPCVILIAIASFVIWYVIVSAPLALCLKFSISVLVISCPCALGIATPAAIAAACYKAAAGKIIFRSPQAIENLSRVKHFVFDKTGTLTTGSFKIGAVEPYDHSLSYDDILALSASLERFSSHLIAKTIVSAADGLKIIEADSYSYVPLKGVKGKIQGHEYALFNESALHDLSDDEQNFISSRAAENCIWLFLLKDGELAGALSLTDELKSDSRALFDKMHKLGVKTSLLSGDGMAAVKMVADKLNISSYGFSLDPEQKAQKLRCIKKEDSFAAMVGDGINDSVALTEADVGISVSGASDIAVSACDVILLKTNSLIDVYNAYQLSKKSMSVIKQNLFFALVYNVLFIPVAAGALYSSFSLSLNPMICSILMGLSSVCVVLNALRLCSFKFESSESTGMTNSINSQGRGMSRVSIKIEGMMCPHCEASVKKALSALENVHVLSVSHKEGNAVIEVSDDADFDRIKDLISQEGYEVKDIVRD